MKLKLSQYFRLKSRPCGETHTADAFVVLGFGLGPDGTAGQSNRAIARWLLSHNKDGRPALAQMGIAWALDEIGPRPPWLAALPHHPDLYVDTYGAALQAWLWLEQMGARRVALVCHPLQSQRAAWLFGRLPLTELIIPILPFVPFDPQSVHVHTRSRWRYVLHELVLARPRLVLMAL